MNYKKIIFYVFITLFLKLSWLCAIATNTLKEIEHNLEKNPYLLKHATTACQTNTESIKTEILFDDAHKKYAPKEHKKWTLIVYMAADNDLAPFSRKNLNQMINVGSTAHINIVVHLDTRIGGNKKITKRYLIQKNELVVLNQNDPNTQSMDSGDPHTLISCCQYAINNFSADHYGLILWNHGIGIIDITRPRSINPFELFIFNTETNLIELDRSVPFLKFLEIKAHEPRGICFDDTTGHYLTNQGLEYALKTICNNYLNGKKFDIIGFDACHMSMLEIANIIKEYSHITVGSEEVELGAGWRYDLVLEPFLHGSINRYMFAEHIVKVYGQTYAKITNDYTQSAIDLDQIEPLEETVNSIALLLIECLKNQVQKTVYEAIKTSRHKLLCTHFDEPSFLDLYDLFSNLLNNLHNFKLKNTVSQKNLVAQLKQLLHQGCNQINQVVFANVVGKNLHKAKGIAIYFPERRIHRSYEKTKFNKTNSWPNFINLYTQLAHTT